MVGVHAHNAMLRLSLGVRDDQALGEADGQHQEAREAARLHLPLPVAVYAGHHAPLVDNVRPGETTRHTKP